MSQTNEHAPSKKRPSAAHTTYITRTEFEEKYRELKTKVADLRKDVTALKERLGST